MTRIRHLWSPPNTCCGAALDMEHYAMLPRNSTCAACVSLFESEERPAADRIRALHAADPRLTPTELARMTGSARGAVYAALKATPGRKGGRPRKGTDCTACGGTGRVHT